MILLQDIVDIVSGATLREKPTPEPNGSTYVIQVRDVASPYNELADDPLRTELPSVPKQQLLQPQDILLLAKGPRNPAVLYTKSWPRAIAMSFFFRLRVLDPATTDAGYLTWYLNSTPGQTALQSLRQGSSVAGITKPLLAGLEIPLPNLQVQRHIAHVADALRREAKLADQLREKRAWAIEQALLNQLNDHD